MHSTTNAKTASTKDADARTLKRILKEGYGPGAWHGPDLKAALADVTPEGAFWRPAPERHSIAEIALHHAYCARSVRGQLLGVTPEPFVLEGDDWFALSEPPALTWHEILGIVEAEQKRLGAAMTKIGTDRARSALSDDKVFDLVVGITCHAVYHAGQVQLLKRLYQG